MSVEDIRQYGPMVLAWALFVSRRRPEDAARRSLRFAVLALAVALTLLSPAVSAAVGQLSGVPGLPRLLGHGSVLAVAWAVQGFLGHLAGTGRPSRGHAWWIGGAFAVMCVVLWHEPGLPDTSPWVVGYWTAYLAGQAPVFSNVIRVGRRHARSATDPVARVGVRLIVLGTATALLYLTNKVIYLAAHQVDVEYAAGGTFFARAVLPAASHVLVLVGAGLPALAGWLRRYRTYQELRPLWRALYRASPAIALDPPTCTVLDTLVPRDLHLRLYRRVIEIRDGLLVLQPYRDPAVAADAREDAARAGIRDERLEAVVEAATVAAALRARAGGTAPAAAAAPVPITGGRDLDSDTAFLSRVARAYRHREVTGQG
jgi:hypothetical protein